MRKSIDGLAVIIKAKYNLDPYCKALFLFCGRRCDRIKGLLWENDGFLLLYKRLECLDIERPKSIRQGKKVCCIKTTSPKYSENSIEKFLRLW